MKKLILFILLLPLLGKAQVLAPTGVTTRLPNFVNNFTKSSTYYTSGFQYGWFNSLTGLWEQDVTARQLIKFYYPMTHIDSIVNGYIPITGNVTTSRLISTGLGLLGGGDLSTNRTHIVDTSVIVHKNWANTVIPIATLARIGGKADTSTVKINAQSGITTIDMHYGILKGHGGLAAENYGAMIYTVSSSATAGATSIVLSANSSVAGSTTTGLPLIAGQLMTYLATDGNYYTVSIGSISGATLTINSGLVQPIATGNNVFNFYFNAYHPNLYGMNAIADNIALKATTQYTVEARSLFSAYNSGITVIDTANNYNNPGSTNVTSYTVTSPIAATDGVLTTPVVYKTGAYKAVLYMNTLGNPVVVYVAVNGLSYAYTVTTNEPTYIEAPFNVSSANSAVTLLVRAANNGDTFKIVQEAKILKQSGVAPKLNAKQTWVVVGDSWGSGVGFGDIIIQRLRAKFPNANIINQCVGGSTTYDVIGRWASVVAAKPDIVLLIDGTNDYANLGYSKDIFSYKINEIKTLTGAIGAHFMVLTPSVGPQYQMLSGSPVGGPMVIDRSRQFATYTRYNDETIPYTPPSQTLQQVTTAGNTSTLGITLGGSGTGNTPTNIYTDGTAGNPALTVFKNTNATGSVISRVLYYNSGTADAWHSTTNGTRTFGADTANTFVKNSPSFATGLLLSNGTDIDPATYATPTNSIQNNSTTTAQTAGININGSLIGSTGSTNYFAWGTTKAIGSGIAKAVIIDASNGYSFFAGGGSATPSGVVMGGGANYGTLSGYNSGTPAFTNLYLQPNGFNASIGVAPLTNGTLTLRAGSTTVAPIIFTSGSLIITPYPGAEEYLTDKRYFTISSGSARKEYTFNDVALNSGIVPVTTTNGRLTNSAVTTTEIGYVSGVTSSIQTQLNGKGNGTVTSITPGWGHTSSTPITSIGTITIDSTLVRTTLNSWTKAQADGRYGQLSTNNTWGGVNAFSNPITVSSTSTAAYASSFTNLSSTGYGGSIRGGDATHYSLVVQNYSGSPMFSVFGNGDIFATARINAGAAINLKGYTVATLPTPTMGDIAYVTDALTPASLAIVVGGGSSVVPVFYNGTNWIVE